MFAVAEKASRLGTDGIHAALRCRNKFVRFDLSTVLPSEAPQLYRHLTSLDNGGSSPHWVMFVNLRAISRRRIACARRSVLRNVIDPTNLRYHPHISRRLDSDNGHSNGEFPPSKTDHHAFL